ncbi:hypothetical protein ABFS82_14G301800 [Erythranthe guttata]|uniref:la-related protein 1B-like isoform X2 n=1 Tax=Erythranthe guttata TaxID=4155 RepID=UPI00064DF9CF|nr:PREDICTED: la-related protein 1B-like isoform X2 [Erythranthe guttata]|eukprot:XP_012839196.1 PREDICTED: la-related protein 1B-like isoform X2 [Erythranthe guttata]
MVTDNSAITTADVASNGGGVNSPQSLRRSLPAPWASVVRGDTEQTSSPTAAAAAASASPTVAPGSSSSPPAEQVSAPNESSGLEAQPESSDVNGSSNAGPPRRPAWNRPVNGVVEPVSVMGGDVSWPALSETARAGPRSSSDTPRPVSDGLVSSSQAPIISQPPQRPANNNVHANHAGSNPRPRSRNRNGGGGGGGGGGSNSVSGPSQNSFNQPPSLPMPPPYPVFEAPYGMVPPVLDTSLRGARPVGGVGGSQSHTGNDHSSPRNNSRRNNYGPRPRGDGPYHNNHGGGRRDQDRRDVHHPPPFMTPLPGGYMPPPLPPGAGPFMAPPPMRLFPAPMGFDMVSPYMYVPAMSPEPFRMPIGPPLPPMFLPPANEEEPLESKIVRQIDFYFSDANLVKDNFLRSKMDDQGWVPITLIAAFRKVTLLTNDIPLILESMRSSAIVEVQGDKVRRRNEWKRWLPLYRGPNPDSEAYASTSTSESTVAASLAAVSLNDGENGDVNASEGQAEMAATGSLTGHQSVLTKRDDTQEEIHPDSV